MTPLTQMMSHINLNDFYTPSAQTAFYEQNSAFSYLELRREIELATDFTRNIPVGSVVAIEGTLSFKTCALFFALANRACIVVPVARGSFNRELLTGLPIEYLIRPCNIDSISIEASGTVNSHPLITYLRERNHSGLVVYTSSTTGKAKPVLHDLHSFFSYLNESKKSSIKKVIAFNSFDRIAGIFLLLSSLSCGSSLISLEQRSPETVGSAIEKYKAQVLPTSPSFLNLMILNKIHVRYDLSSLKLINFGSESASDFTIKKIREILPNVALRQIFGSTEIGLIKTITDTENPQYFKSGDSRIELRVNEGMVEIRSPLRMLGYLDDNICHFDRDGWTTTGDLAEMQDGMIRILGRRSELIKVGGDSVFPSEVESVILEMENVASVLVTGEKHPLLGQIVSATIELVKSEAPNDFRKRLLRYCAGKLEKFKVPQKIMLSEQLEYVGDFKKKRSVKS